MNTEQVKEELSKKIGKDDRENSKYMMATEAYHQLGDISSDSPDLCYYYNETPDYYVGAWVFGFGFFDVLFPKSTTRELTEEEITHFHGMKMQINSTPIGELKIK